VTLEFKNTPIFIYALNMRTAYPDIYSKYSYIIFSDWFDLMIYCFQRHFQQYFSYIMAISFSGGRIWSTRRKPSNMCRQLVDFLTCGCESNGSFFAFRRKSKDQLTWNQKNVSEWSEMYTRGLLFQCAGTVKIQPIVFVWNKADLIIISSHW
jgi:hypothetical protein